LEKLYGKDKAEKETMMNASNVFSTSTWIGIRSGNRIDHIGFFQGLFQNGAHTSIGNQNYYLNYRDFQRGLYLYSGYYNPFTLYGH